MKIEIENITTENFAPFGYVLEFTQDMTEPFHIIVREEKDPWRLALLRFDWHSVERLENHPHSMESFEPLEGISVLFVSENSSPEKIRAFLLDKPVCLFKGVWHEVLALSSQAKVKITENLEVTAEYFNLKKPLQVFAGD
ncbi:MAG: ureidoglycolate lyase [Treponema sp.]|nr:ureidoglycolate lyase [Treponema sp.]